VNLKEFFEENGTHLLEPLGSDQWALDKEKALELIHLLAKHHVGVLGGDILKYTGDEIDFLGEGWYYERREDEKQDEFASRSFIKSKETIELYSGLTDSELYRYTIVPSLLMHEYYKLEFYK